MLKTPTNKQKLLSAKQLAYLKKRRMAKQKQKYVQGIYHPINRDKYTGKYPIIGRSSWELQVFYKLDTNPNIKSWGSESVVIEYVSPIDGKKHRYFTDIDYYAIDKATNRLQRYIIEIKPIYQTKPPVKGRKSDETYKEEVKTYMVNCAKWKACANYCARYGYKFLIWTEEALFPYCNLKIG